MNLYLISQDVNKGYGIFDAVIVAAKDEEDAKNYNPGATEANPDCIDSWCKPEFVKVKFLGTACIGVKAGEILSSFLDG